MSVEFGRTGWMGWTKSGFQVGQKLNRPTCSTMFYIPDVEHVEHSTMVGRAGVAKKVGAGFFKTHE